MSSIELFETINHSLFEAFKSCGYILRARASPGLWLVPLIPFCLLASVWRYSSINNASASISNLYFSTAILSCSLLVSTVLYIWRFFPEAGEWIREFNAIFVFPPIWTFAMLLYSQNGVLLSLIGGLLSSYGVLAGLPTLLTVAPGCFTLGEAVVIVHSAVLFLFASFVNVSHLALSQTSPIKNDSLSSETATAILQIGLLTLLIMIGLLIIFPTLRKPKQFYVLFGLFTLGAITIPHILLGGSPVIWILQFLTRDIISVKVIIFWVVCLSFGIVFILLHSSTNIKATTSQRKVFHMLAVAVFAVGLVYIPDILYLASGIIFAIFVSLEMIRVLRIPPFSGILQNGFTSFVDDKDNLVALTPLYLLAGVAAPLWISPLKDVPIPKTQLLPLFSGILAIGIGDSAASFVGSRYGKNYWAGSWRTIEGSIACFLSQIITVIVLVYLGVLPQTLSYLKTIGAVGAVTFVEAKTDQVDNLVLPLILYLLSV